MSKAISSVPRILLAVVVVPLAAIAGLASVIFNLKAKSSPEEVATYLRNFIEGRGEEWDWDDFTSVPIADPRLENIRRQAAAVDLPATKEDLAILRSLLVKAEQMANPTPKPDVR